MTKAKLKKFTYQDVQSWNPCYDAEKHISKDWKGDVIDILNMDNIPFQDRLWCVLRKDLISERTMRLFAVWSYRQTLKFIPNPDLRSIEAANVSERFAEGKATKEELEAARSAAWSATRSDESTAWSAAWSAARSDESAARSADESAVESARSAAWSAARSAIQSADEFSTRSSESAVWSAQKDKLIEMILEENK